MTAKTPKKTTKKKTARQAYEAKTQAVSVRVDPIVKYALDLMSRAQRRSVSSIIEWAIVEASKKTPPGELEDEGIPSVKALADQTYSPNELERIIHLGILTPDLLDFEERRIWTVIRLTPEFWNSHGSTKIVHYGGTNLTPEDFNWWKFGNNLEHLEPVIREWANRDPVTSISERALEGAGWDGEILSRQNHGVPF